MLTKLQRDLLAFIIRYADENSGMGPSYDEMARGIGVSSKGNVHRQIVGLENRGFIRRIPNRSRAIEVLRRPDSAEAPIDRARRNLAIAQRVLEDATGAPFDATLALIAIKTAIAHLGAVKGGAT